MKENELVIERVDCDLRFVEQTRDGWRTSGRCEILVVTNSQSKAIISSTIFEGEITQDHLQTLIDDDNDRVRPLPSRCILEKRNLETAQQVFGRHAPQPD
jgi:hypothetical protein